MITRRGLLGMFAAGAGAAIVTTPGLLMRVKPLRGGLLLREFARRALDPAVQSHIEDISTALFYGDDALRPAEFSGLNLGDTISFPKVGDEIVANKSLWRVSWSTSSQFRIHP